MSAMIDSIDGWQDGDLFAAFQSMSFGSGTRVDKKLPAAKVLPPIPARTGSAAPAPLPSSGGGVASPIYEDATNGRTYFAERIMYSTDGLVYCKWQPINTLNTHDNDGAALVFIFRDQP